MHHRPINLRITDVHEELHSLMSRLDQFPTPEEVGEHSGPQGAYVAEFNKHLSDTVWSARLATRAVINELAHVDSTVRAALEDLKSHDEDVAANVEQIEAYLDSAVEQAEPAPTIQEPAADKGETEKSTHVDYGGFGPEGTSA